MRRKSCKSHGERIITETLNSLNVYYKREMSFETCRSLKNRPLRFDFYIPDYNVCIEFDGEQHYREHKVWGYEKFVKTQLTDNKKTEYCLNNNIHLIRIKYDEKLEDIKVKIINFL